MTSFFSSLICSPLFERDSQKWRDPILNHEFSRVVHNIRGKASTVITPDHLFAPASLNHDRLQKHRSQKADLRSLQTQFSISGKKRQEIPEYLTAPVHSKCLKVPTCSNHPFCWYPIASQSKIPHLWSILPSLEPPNSVTWRKLLNASLTPIGPCETRLVPLVMFLGQSVRLHSNPQVIGKSIGTSAIWIWGFQTENTGCVYLFGDLLDISWCFSISHTGHHL